MAMFLMTSLSACSWFTNDKKPTDIVLDEKSALLVENSNLFGYNMLNQVLTTEDENKNVMVSPLSVSEALSMTINGANGNTFTQMKLALGFEGLDLQDINKSNNTVVNALLNHDPKVTLNIANSIWYRNDFSPKATFVNDNKTWYNAEVNSYDPAQLVKAMNTMNNWVDDKTKGKIDKIIDNVDPSSVMFLINAIYFKAQWKTEFKKKDTRNNPFTLDDGTEKEVPTMIGEVELSYYNQDNYSVIKLPYGFGKFDMLIFLPEEGYTTSDIAGEIANTDISQLSTLTMKKRDIWLPKFEFSYENMLNDELTGLGMTDAFNPGAADFSNISSDKGLYISRVMHKTYIKTDEEGSEAAAVTAVTMDVTSVGPSGIIKIDHSFLFAIVEEDTQSILFIGRVYDPTLSK